MFFPIVLSIYFHEILLVGKMLLLRLLMGVVQDLIHQLGGTRDIENVLQLVEALLGDFTQASGTVAVEVRAHAGMQIIQILVDPLADWTEFLVGLIVESAGIDAIAVVEDIGAQILDHDILLAAFLRFHVKPASHRELAQGHDDQARRIGTWAARHARHALAAIPNRVASQEFLQIGLVLACHDVHDILRIVLVELGSRTDGRTHAAVHAGLHPLFYPVILI